MPAQMTIELNGLRFFATHGWHPEEAKTANEFEVNIVAAFRVGDAVITSLEETINYAEVYALVQQEFSIPRQLLETCAMNIAAVIHQRFPAIGRVEVGIKKLNAPITGFTGTVGIRYAKEFR